MRKTIAAFLGAGALAVAALPAVAAERPSKRPDKHHPGAGKGHNKPGAPCGKTINRGPDAGYEVIFDGTRRCFERWKYAGGSQVTLQRDGTLQAAPGAPNLGVLWYAARPYGDFSLRLQFRDDSPEGGARANSGVQVRFPAPKSPVPGCDNAALEPAWIAVNCGHEIQINDNTDGDARKTGSIYGFADLDIAAARPTDRGVWNDLEIEVIGQTYKVFRNGVQINEFVNAPGIPFPGRPDDPGSDGRGLVGYIGLQAHGAPTDIDGFLVATFGAPVGAACATATVNAASATINDRRRRMPGWYRHLAPTAKLSARGSCQHKNYRHQVSKVGTKEPT